MAIFFSQLVIVKKYSNTTVRRDNTIWCAMKPALFHIALRRHNGEDLAGILPSVDKQFVGEPYHCVGLDGARDEMQG